MARRDTEFDRDWANWRKHLLTIDGIGRSRKERLLDAALQEARAAERARVVAVLTTIRDEELALQKQMGVPNTRGVDLIGKALRDAQDTAAARGTTEATEHG